MKDVMLESLFIQSRKLTFYKASTVKSVETEP